MDLTSFLSKAKSQFNYQFIKYCVTGICNTIIDISVFFLLFKLNNMIVLSNIGAFTAAASFSYFMNKYWVFQSRANMSIMEFVKFYALLLIIMGVNTGLIYGLQNHMQVLPAKIFATMITAIGGFFAIQFYFKNTQNNSL